MSERSLFMVLGNQLFPPQRLSKYEGTPVFMAEDHGLCTYVRHHQQKLVLYLAAMRAHAEALRDRGFEVDYRKLDAEGEDPAYEDKLAKALRNARAKKLVHYEIEDRFMAERIREFAEAEGIEREVLDSPMFVTSRSQFSDWHNDAKRPHMADFYRWQRQRLGVLVDEDGKPEGGKWSFDADNRKPLPKDVTPPDINAPAYDDHVGDVQELVERRFGDHPGEAGDFWLPTTRRQGLAWVRRFLDDRLADFGPYEDALTTRSDTLYHSVLTPVLNLGLVTPDEVVSRVVEHASDHDVPLNSLEGFVRQVIGWREFIRGIYHHYGEKQERGNYWRHRRRLTRHWYEADTGIPPLDDAIGAARRLGYNHHIQRLMVVGNLMTLAQIEPRAAHEWFMEMYVDSSDWVMGPNVYGMALFSDGGIFATKPYVCGSNYLRKMSDYGKGEWCDVVDGLYWGFVERNREFFASNPRLSVMTRALDKLAADRRERIDGAAKQFLRRCTRSR